MNCSLVMRPPAAYRSPRNFSETNRDMVFTRRSFWQTPITRTIRSISATLASVDCPPDAFATGLATGIGFGNATGDAATEGTTDEKGTGSGAAQLIAPCAPGKAAMAAAGAASRPA